MGEGVDWCDGRGCGCFGKVGAEDRAKEGGKEEGQANYGGWGGRWHCCDCRCRCDIGDGGILVDARSSSSQRAPRHKLKRELGITWILLLDTTYALLLNFKHPPSRECNTFLCLSDSTRLAL